VELAAGKTVHLATAGGASLTIEDGNIVIACPGTIKVHAGSKAFVGPTQLNYPLASPGDVPFKLKYVVRDHQGQPLSNTEYTLVMGDGSTRSGRTNAAGETEELTTLGPETIDLFVGGDLHEGYYLAEG